uniref:Transcription initiation factor TFIID subunit 1 n=1 Tax=Phallusia mammillata TaxID=59560 RepID=A0A6F9DUY5_9ASCI|nr:transcription initiation factor TFIID subunit 1-like [Phallusia mammillata]
MSGSDSDGENVSSDLVGFMFGNIDKHGHLENDVFDEKSKTHLMQLTTLAGLGEFVSRLTKDESSKQENTGSHADYRVEAAPDAVDYSNIDELAEESEMSVDMKAMASHFSRDNDSDDYDADDDVQQKTPHLSSDKRSQQKQDSSHKGSGDGDFIMPSIVSHSHRFSGSSPERKQSSDSERLNRSGGRHDKKKLGGTKIERRKRRKEKLMQQHQQSEEEMIYSQKYKELEEKVNSKDICELFPEFRPNQVLRFLRLFGGQKATSLPNIWRNCRRRKKKKRPQSSIMDPQTEAPKEASRWLEPWTAPPPPMPSLEECASDEEFTMLKPIKSKKSSNQAGGGNAANAKSKIPEWRYGPAALWYDMLGVPETGEGFDYGFKLKNPEETSTAAATKSITNDPSFPSPEHFYMVSQVRWEDDIIWNADDVRYKVGKSIHTTPDSDEKYKLRVDRAAQAGWVPTSTQRTALPHSSTVTTRPITLAIEKPSVNQNDSTVSSIFPIDNYELIYGDWEKDIIWDDQNMDFIPKPTVFKFDPNDENIILGMPDEPKTCNEADSKDTKKENQKKSKLASNKGKDANKDDPDLSKKDGWNLSNDHFYDPKQAASSGLAIGLMSSVLQHSNPAMELQPMFFPTVLGQARLQSFHRPQFRRYQHGAMAKPGFHQVHCVMKHLRKKAKQREQERAASGGGEVFFMRKPEDLSALDGHLILAEYSEEFPPLLSQVGMALKVKNYHKRKPDKDSDSTRYRYGETVYSHSSPFLGTLAPGQSLQAFECNMYRAPIYEHRSKSTDFLIIRTRHNYFIRHVPSIFTVGQLCPLVEVPGPNSKKATNHVRDFLQVFIYRMFAKSREKPKKIRMEEVRKAFPNHSESSIRKRLKLCADFHRTGQDSNWWVIKKDFRLPTEEEMRAMVSPEQSCGFYSMIAAEQRLKDAGYGEKTMLIQPEDDNEEEHQMKVDEEVLNAPWNTTRAFISALKGKCLLQVTGPADPTGCGEGFSYVKVPMKPQQPKTESAPAPPKKLVTGTDADLRRLSLSNAKQLLKKFGVPDEEIRKLSRWEVIDVVRTMSTEQARAGEGGMSKFARGTRFSVAEHQERYKEECQRIFDLQNKVLSSHDILSTDEDSSSADDSDFEEMGKNIENLLSNKKSTMQMSLEKEEQERKELLKMVREDRSSESLSRSSSSVGIGRSSSSMSLKKDREDDTASISSLSSLVGRCLKIHRKFQSDDGTEYMRVETVRKPEVIDAYVRIRSSKNEDFIKKFMMMDEQHREEMRREKRRIQEQLRRIKRNQEKDKINQDRERKKEKDRKGKDVKVDNLKGSQMKCGACGQLGHMRTNRYCPMYNRSAASQDRPVALTEEQEEDMERKMITDSQDLIKVEGTKITLSKDLIKNAEVVRRKSLVLKFQKPDTPSSPSAANLASLRKKRKYQGSVTHCDYLTRIAKKKERRRADPKVTLSTLMENILNGIRDLPETLPFQCPVNPRLVKDYYKIIEKPMDLQTMRENIRKHTYLSRADFREHIDLIVQNSRIYNGVDNNLTRTAQQMLDYTDKKFKVMEDKLMRLEKAINPLLDDDDQVAFSFILDNVLTQKMMVVLDSWPFHNPVNKKFVPDYYTVVQRPMDLGTIRKNVQKHLYQNRGQFMEHVELILTNSSRFNGADSTFTETARKIVSICRNALDENDEHLTQLENDIAAAKKAAEAEVADIDDVTLPSSRGLEDDLMDDDSNMSYADDKMVGDSDVDVETMNEDTRDGTNVDDQLDMAFRGVTSSTDDAVHPSKSRLLEDLLMSDGEMSGTEESEDEGDNPFAHRSDSDVTDDARDDSLQAPPASSLLLAAVNNEGDADSVHNAVTSYLDEALSQANLESTATPTEKPVAPPAPGPSRSGLTLSSEGEDSDPASGGSFVSVGGEVVSDSDLSDD